MSVYCTKRHKEIQYFFVLTPAYPCPGAHKNEAKTRNGKEICAVLIMTAKLPRRKLAFSVAAAALVCCAALALNLGGGAFQAASASASGLPSPKGVKSNEDRVAYLEGYGWQVLEEPLATEELLIPEEMDESYDDYLALQTSQGFYLEQYAGKRVKRYTYEITNYPTGEAGVQANLMLYRNTVIGGEVLSPQMDGFLHGLAMPAGS